MTQTSALLEARQRSRTMPGARPYRWARVPAKRRTRAATILIPASTLRRGIAPRGPVWASVVTTVISTPARTRARARFHAETTVPPAFHAGGKNSVTRSTFNRSPLRPVRHRRSGRSGRAGLSSAPAEDRLLEDDHVHPCVHGGVHRPVEQRRMVRGVVLAVEPDHRGVEVPDRSRLPE